MSRIDGVIVSHGVSNQPSVHALSPVELTQHRPVHITLPVAPGFHDCHRWRLGDSIAMGGWSADAIARFDELVAVKDVDGAWQVWHLAAGGAQPWIEKSTL